MEPQLFLLPDYEDQAELPPSGEEAPLSWRLDEHTRDLGRQGVARARAALRLAAARAAERSAA